MAKAGDAGVSKGLKSLFVIHGIASVVSGILLLFVPYTWAEMTKYGPIDPHPLRLFGAFTIALAVKDWFGFLAKRWSEVRIIVIMEVVWAPLAALTSLYVILFAGAPSAVWMNVVTFGIFAVAWIFFYLKYR